MKHNYIVLIRDNTFNERLFEKDKTYTYLDIIKLKKYVCKDIRVNLKVDLDISDCDIINDYIFLCFLLGNDFLEHIPSLVIKQGGINVIIKYYTQVLNTGKYKSLVDENVFKSETQVYNDSINIKMLTELFYHFSNNEDIFYNRVNKKTLYKDKYDIEYINNNVNEIHIYNKDLFKINSKKDYKHTYYKFYGINNINQCCEDYITGLYWVLGYYNNHHHNNWSWYYNHEVVPFATDIYNYLKQYNSLQNSLKNSLQNSKPLNQLEQLLIVLPKESLIEILKTKYNSCNYLNVDIILISKY